MPSRFHWDCDLPKAAAFKVAGKLFLASGRCGRASCLDSKTATIFEVADDRDEAPGSSRLVKYFAEIDQMDLAEGAAQGLLRYPTDLDSWIHRAKVATATGDEEASTVALKPIMPGINRARPNCRSPSPGSLYRPLRMIRGFGLRINQPPCSTAQGVYSLGICAVVSEDVPSGRARAT